MDWKKEKRKRRKIKEINRNERKKERREREREKERKREEREREKREREKERERKREREKDKERKIKNEIKKELKIQKLYWTGTCRQTCIQADKRQMYQHMHRNISSQRCRMLTCPGVRVPRRLPRLHRGRVHCGQAIAWS